MSNSPIKIEIALPDKSTALIDATGAESAVQMIEFLLELIKSLEND
jgi:hypothetical protein